MMFPPDLLLIIRITVIAGAAATVGKVGVLAFLTFPKFAFP